VVEGQKQAVDSTEVKHMERNDQLFITRMMMRGKVTVVWRSAS